MEKRSKHWADVLKWLESVVDSCKTEEQALVCEQLIDNYQKCYEEKLGFDVTFKLTTPLQRKLSNLSDPFKNVLKKV